MNVDVAFIAGLGAYCAAKLSNPSVMMIVGGPYVTICARVGCMASQFLIAAAEAEHQIERAPGLSMHHTDGHEVMGRVKRERGRFVGFLLGGTSPLTTNLGLRPLYR